MKIYRDNYFSLSIPPFPSFSSSAVVHVVLLNYIPLPYTEKSIKNTVSLMCIHECLNNGIMSFNLSRSFLDI